VISANLNHTVCAGSISSWNNHLTRCANASCTCSARGAKDHIEADLDQLFRRVAFNVAIGNRDDHLRNHGFLLTPTGWRLAPAFDLNPNTERADHVLNIDESDNRPSLANAIETSEWYVGSKDRGRVVITEVLNETRKWRQAAQALKIARADVELTATAFAESDLAHN